MEGVSLVRIDIACVQGLTDNDRVFSAPRYCDSTENKGAYINIGPELKLDFHKFDAVPHPDIKPMVGPYSTFSFMRVANFEQAYAQNSLTSMM